MLRATWSDRSRFIPLIVVPVLLAPPAFDVSPGATATAGELRVWNATEAQVECEFSRTKSRPAATVKKIPAQHWAVWSISEAVGCRIHGTTYRLQPDKAYCVDNEGSTLQLFSLPQLTLGETPEIAGLKAEVRQLKLRLKGHDDKLSGEEPQTMAALHDKIARLETEKSALQARVDALQKTSPQSAPVETSPQSAPVDRAGATSPAKLLGPKETYAQLATGNDLVVLTCPEGGDVYLSDPAQPHPWARHFLGTSPLRASLPPGSYRLALLPPAHVPAGSWAAPGHAVQPPAARGSTESVLQIECEVNDKRPTVVKGLWLPEDGQPLVRLSACCNEVPTRLAPPRDEFEPFAIEAILRARLPNPGSGDLQLLHQLLSKVGYVRYALSGQRALDLEFRPWERPYFKATYIEPDAHSKPGKNHD